MSQKPQHYVTPGEAVMIAQQYQAGAGMKDLAEQLGVHRHTVSRCLRQLGVPLHGQGMPDNRIDEAAELYRAGWSLQRLADRYGCSVNNVRKRLIASGVPMRPRQGWKYG